MTAEEPFHHFGRGPSRFALCRIVPVALVDDRDLFARRRGFGPVLGRSGRVVSGLAHRIRLALGGGICKRSASRVVCRPSPEFLDEQPAEAAVNSPDRRGGVRHRHQLLDPRGFEPGAVGFIPEAWVTTSSPRNGEAGRIRPHLVV